jgi:hypothetical protein
MAWSSVKKKRNVIFIHLFIYLYVYLFNCKFALDKLIKYSLLCVRDVPALSPACLRIVQNSRVVTAASLLEHENCWIGE